MVVKKDWTMNLLLQIASLFVTSHRGRSIFLFRVDIDAIHSTGIQSTSFPEFILDGIIILTKLSDDHLEERPRAG